MPLRAIRMFKSLFGSNRQDDAETVSLRSIRTDFANLLIEPSGDDWARALQSWSWLSLPASQPIFVSAFGDAFFRQAGQVIILDTLEGNLDSVARDLRELRAKLDAVELQDRF